MLESHIHIHDADEALMQIVAQEGRTARVLRDMDHSLFTVSTSTHPLALSNRGGGGGNDLSFWEISTLEDVLSQESSNFNTPLHHCRACPETLMVAEQTQLPREDIYVIYIHKVSSGDYTPPQPVTAGAPTAPSVTATAPTTDDMPEWAAWDRLFLKSIKPMASLFDESYNEAFKIYAAVTVVMGIARKTITADKKHMGMGKDSRLSGVLAWLKARVGVHKLTIFDCSPKMFERYLTFWNWVQQLSLELSDTTFGESEYDQDRSKILDMLIV